MVISHDRYFLDRVTTRTMELKHGRLLQSNGSYTRHLELTADRNEVLRRHYENQKRRSVAWKGSSNSNAVGTRPTTM